MSTANQHITLRESIQFYLIDSKTLIGKIIDTVIILLNILVVIIFILNTYALEAESVKLLKSIEDVIVIIFIIEYIARLYGARKRIRHLFAAYTIIDLFAILPSIIEPLFSTVDIGIFKLLRMFRVFRVLRFMRFFETTDFFFGKISDEMLKVFRLGMTVFMIFFVSSGLFYLAESNADDGVKNFGEAFYFTVVSLTTVGFGDIVPVTQAGRFVTVICILSGIILIPWQAAEIVRHWLRISSKRSVVCSTCGLKYHDHDAVHCKACGNVIYQEYSDPSV